jgi:hypothetical protein
MQISDAVGFEEADAGQYTAADTSHWRTPIPSMCRGHYPEVVMIEAVAPVKADLVAINATTQSEAPRRMSLGRSAGDPVPGTFDWAFERSRSRLGQTRAIIGI